MHASPICRIGVLAVFGDMHLNVFLHKRLIQMSKKRAARKAYHPTIKAAPILLQLRHRD